MPELRFYPLDIHYSVREGKPIIYLFGRSAEDGSRVWVHDHSFAPYFYIIPKAVPAGELAKELAEFSQDRAGRAVKFTRLLAEKKTLGADAVSAVKAYTEVPGDVPLLRSSVRGLPHVSEVLEADILFVKRYLIDKGITPFTLCSAQGTWNKSDLDIPVFDAEEVREAGTDIIPTLRILSLDIETYSPFGTRIEPEKNPIIMAALTGNGFSKVITWKRFKTSKDYIEFVDGELELLEKLKNYIIEFSPDILCGYNSDAFDLPYIKTRAEKYKLDFAVGLDSSSLLIGRGRYVTTSIAGILHLDVFRFIIATMRTSLDVPSYDLNSVSLELLGKGKADADLEDLPKTWDNHPELLEPYCEYNLQDALLTHELLVKLLPNIKELVKLVGTDPFDTARMSYSQLVEWYLIRKAHHAGILVPNKPHHDDITDRREHTYEGAFVFEPTPGLFSNIVVFDFRSLYPSIISAHNISPETVNCPCCKDTAEKIEEKSGESLWFCTKKQGFIASVIGEIILQREAVRDQMKKLPEPSKVLHARQMALKTLANSMYGYMGFFAARWYSLECARAIAALGRQYIQHLISQAEKEGFRVLYSDTDSIFITLEDKPKEAVNAFIAAVNKTLPQIMSLKSEGFYTKGLFVATKEDKKDMSGAKKKYALLSQNGKITIKGFETIRRNWSPIAREVQSTVISMLLTKNDPDAAFSYVKEIIARMRRHEIPLEQAIILTQLQKEIGAYDSIGPHVAVARRLRDRGKKVGPGSIIKYVIISGTEKIRDRARLP
ncbi:hypothetical protein COY95_00675, partial [Candidatus Woesearchaeota archaeon CG_4_10_14_0_8_um_filter_47_5]